MTYPTMKKDQQKVKKKMIEYLMSKTFKAEKRGLEFKIVACDELMERKPACMFLYVKVINKPHPVDSLTINICMKDEINRMVKYFNYPYMCHCISESFYQQHLT